MKKTNRCKTCLWWKEERSYPRCRDLPRTGICCRYPPTHSTRLACGNQHKNAERPRMLECDFCGEHCDRS